ncbi:MAG: hypothetical protein KDM91_22190 [Verrucomicrobiae bacterium]|nr:hypothetical protein [Verrucomicrobiae bacterium]
MPLPKFLSTVGIHALAGLTHAPARPEGRYRLALLKLDRIGDFVLASGAIRYALAQVEGPKLLVVSEVAAPLAHRLFPEADCLTMPAFAPGLLRDMLPIALRRSRTLRSLRAETLLHLRYQPTHYHRLVQRWIPARRALAMEDTTHPLWREAIRLPLVSDRELPYPSLGEIADLREGALLGCGELEGHRRVMEAWLRRPVTLRAVWPWLEPLRANLPPQQALLVAPFCSARIREYPAEKLIEAVREFHAAHPLPIHVACAPDERARAAALIAAFKRRGLRDVAAVPNACLSDYAGLVSAYRLVLSMDSATAHFAAAFGTPGVALLGGGHFGHFAPWSAGSRFTWLCHRTPCHHCEWRCPLDEAECLAEIPPKTVAEALARQFQRPARSLGAPVEGPAPAARH